MSTSNVKYKNLFGFIQFQIIFYFFYITNKVYITSIIEHDNDKIDTGFGKVTPKTKT